MVRQLLDPSSFQQYDTVPLATIFPVPNVAEVRWHTRKLDRSYLVFSVVVVVVNVVVVLLIRNLACINNALINTREQHFIFVCFFLFFLSFFKLSEMK